MFLDSFTQGQYRVQSLSGKQVFYFEDSDQFGPSKLNPSTDDLSMVPERHWFWAFYTPWRKAGRPTEGKHSGRWGTILHAVRA